MIRLQLAIATKQLDIKYFLEEHGERPPVASIDLDSIEKWKKAKGFEIDNINENCIRLWEPYPDKSDSGRRYSGYDQIWVKVSYGEYREAMIKSLTEMVGQNCNLGNIDADHVVARARLKDFKVSWVNIFPVRRSWNMFFGGVEARQDYKLNDSSFRDGMYYAGGFECLKILLNNIEDLVETAKDTLIVDNEVIRTIKSEMDSLKHL